MRFIFALITLSAGISSLENKSSEQSNVMSMEPTTLKDSMSSTASVLSEPTGKNDGEIAIDPALESSLLRGKSRSVVRHIPNTKVKSASEEIASSSKKSSDATVYSVGLSTLVAPFLAQFIY